MSHDLSWKRLPARHPAPTWCATLVYAMIADDCSPLVHIVPYADGKWDILSRREPEPPMSGVSSGLAQLHQHASAPAHRATTKLDL
jgi:hypothetical protein